MLCHVYLTPANGPTQVNLKKCQSDCRLDSNDEWTNNGTEDEDIVDDDDGNASVTATQQGLARCPILPQGDGNGRIYSKDIFINSLMLMYLRFGFLWNIMAGKTLMSAIKMSRI